MKYISLNNLSANTEIVSSIDIPSNCELIRITCSSYFTLFIDDKVSFYGPERCPEGYARISEINIPKNASSIKIKILYCGVATLDLDDQELFFALEIYQNKKVIINTTDLSFYKSNIYLCESARYSFQRGFIERYNLKNNSLTPLIVKEIEAPIELEGNKIICCYQENKPILIKAGEFTGFKEKGNRRYLEITKKDNQYNIDGEFEKETAHGYRYALYKLEGNKSGLIQLSIDSHETNKAYLYFDECLINNEMIYGRGTVTNLIEVELNSGKNKIISNSVYTAQYLMVIYQGDVKIIPSLILVENSNAKKIKKTGNNDIDLVMQASRNTYMQNSYDIFTDCPGRERSGWLCDGYFIGMGEKYFSNTNRIEKHFLENFILGKCPEIHNDEMVPMCFPGTHLDGTYIPNWALWFILEVDRYYLDTNDKEMLDIAKDRIMGILSFFKKYENEYGLLENLPSWVFIEWSKAGEEEYVKGISFPTNMTYAFVLNRVSDLYHIPSLKEKSDKLVNVINKYSYAGSYYHDNAIRGENNSIRVLLEHTSETAQYYAIFFNINKDQIFINKMINDFSAIKKENENGMPKSNVFIGNFLRFIILIRNKEYKRLLKEAIPYFSKMAKLTHTLWEKDTDDASCNHGLNAALAPLIDECLKNIN